MATFKYRALDKDGHTVTGSLHCETRQHAQQLLRQQSRTPLAIQIVDKKTPSKQARVTLAHTDVTVFTRQLATLIAADTPVAEALQFIASQEQKAKTRDVVQNVLEHLLNGYSLSQALARYPNIFSKLYSATIASGEQSGRLHQALVHLANHLEQQAEFRNKLRLALIYPITMTAITCTIVCFLLLYVVPSILDVFAQTDQTLPTMTQSLLAISHFLRAYAIKLIVIGASVSILVFALLKKPHYQTMAHRLLATLPILGSLWRQQNRARFIQTLSLLLQSGIELIQALHIAQQVLADRPMLQAVEHAIVEIRDGQPLSQALENSHSFDALSIQLIRNGENTGQLPEMLQYIAKQQHSNIQQLLDRSLALFEPILILIMGIVVLFVVLGILLPIFEIGQLVT